VGRFESLAKCNERALRSSASLRVFEEAHKIWGGLTFGRFCNVGRRTARDDATAVFARAGTDIDDPIAAGDDAHVVLHDNHGVSRYNEAVELPDEPLDIGGMEPGRRFIEYVQRVTARDSLQFRRELDALRFTAGQFGCGLAQTQIPETDLT